MFIPFRNTSSGRFFEFRLWNMMSKVLVESISEQGKVADVIPDGVEVQGVRKAEAQTLGLSSSSSQGTFCKRLSKEEQL